MSENQTAERFGPGTNIKREMAERLNGFFQIIPGCGVEKVLYFPNADVFRFETKSGYSFFISAVMRQTNTFLAQVFRELHKACDSAAEDENMKRAIHYLDGTVKDPWGGY
jgi:hypothetical protein